MSTSKNDQHDRVKDATPESINEKIESEMWRRVASYGNKSDAEISTQIEKLNKEWDIERYLGVNMSSLAITGLATAAISKNKRWNILPAIVLGFFFQHAVQGWCPPLPILRSLNIRTRKEIEQEKYALKLIRGDFEHLQKSPSENMNNLREAIARN